MRRLLNAFRNSLRAWTRLVRTEAAFQQEMALLAAALPLGWLLTATWRGYLLLIAAVLVLILVEVLNSGIEAACNAVSREFNADIQLAKDCGSLAVLIAILLAGGTWLLALGERIAGSPL